MSRTFYFDSMQIEQIKDKLLQIQEMLEDSHVKAETIRQQIDEKTHWTGESQKNMIGYLDSVIRYNGDLVNQKAPIANAAKSLEQFLEKLDCFCDDWQQWKELDRIG